MDDDLNSVKTFTPPNGSRRRESGRRFPEMGDFLGEMQNYRLVKLLGEGGMGQAWLAEEIVRGKVLRLTVCKLLPAEVQNDAQEIKKVESLFQLTRTLNHTNICPLYGMEFDPEFGWFFVMGYAEGLPLREWIYMQPNWTRGLPPETVLKILRPLASALDYAHKKRVIHRDIKPENIMFSSKDEDSDLWIIDFGIAAQIHETRSRTSAANESSGTPHYMAPEQFLGELQDARTDQYALGVLAYELLSGRRPFVGNIHALAHQILNVSPKQIKTLSTEANAVLQRVLEKRQVERFPSCTDFVKALEQTLTEPAPQPAAPKLWNAGKNKFPGMTQISTEDIRGGHGQTLRPTAPSPKVRNGQKCPGEMGQIPQPADPPSKPHFEKRASQTVFQSVNWVMGQILTAIGLCIWLFGGLFVLFVWQMLASEIFVSHVPCLLACLAGSFLLVNLGFAVLYKLEGIPRQTLADGITESLISLGFSSCGYVLLCLAKIAAQASITVTEIAIALLLPYIFGLTFTLIWHRRQLGKLRNRNTMRL